MSYSIGKILPTDTASLAAIDQLLIDEGIRRDRHLDYTCAMFDDEMNIIATGSCYNNTLRCLTVSHEHQGEGLMNQIVTHLINIQMEQGNNHLFLYTKYCSAKFFSSLGFQEIVRIPNQIVFMENKRNGFQHYLTKLQSAVKKTERLSPKIAALVMNCNPFTLGHQYLIEKAAAENDVVHLFMLSEDCSFFPYEVRKKLIQAGIAHLSNVVLHDSDSYIISQATFPSYFQKDEDAVIQSHIAIDLQIFTRIAATLGIQRRYVGDEPFSHVTQIYNQAMQQKLPEHGIECIIVNRKTIDGQAISASSVRQAIQQQNWNLIKSLVPQSTFDFLMSDKATPIIKKIQQSKEVIHY